MTESAPITERPTAFIPAWGYPRFRLLWASALAANIGRWIEIVVGAWLVLQLTNSPVLVGLLGTCRFISMAMGPLCGAISDRFNRRLILMAVQGLYAAAALIILVLFATGRIQAWHLFAFTFIGGICYAFYYSTWYAMGASVVESKHIVSAASMLQTANGATSILGPLLGGSLLEVVGPSGAFALVAACFVMSLLALVPVKVGPSTAVARKAGSFGRDLVEGLRYVRNDRFIFSLVLLAVMFNLLIFPYSYVIMPLVARDILNAGAAGYGQLMASIGVGTVLGSLAAGMLPRTAKRGWLTVGALIAWALALMAMAYSRSFLFSALVLGVSGLAQGTAMALVQGLILVRAPQDMWSRVSGIRTSSISALALGTFATGYAAGLWGAPLALVLDAALFIAITAAVVFWAPELVKYK